MIGWAATKLISTKLISTKLIRPSGSDRAVNRDGDSCCNPADVLALLCAGTHPNAILAVDDIDMLLGTNGNDASAPNAVTLSDLQRCYAQTIAATNSATSRLSTGWSADKQASGGAGRSTGKQAANNAGNDAGNGMIIYPITAGAAPGARTAKIFESMAAPGQMLLLVEGQYDLPWYRKAILLLGLDDRVFAIPGGGSNSGVLLEELRRIGIRSVLIRDGDMVHLANPRNGDYALKLDCIEMYAPDKLLADCFGVVPPRKKDVFFKRIIGNASNFPKEIKGEKKRFDRDDVKGIIAARVGKYLQVDSLFVAEVGEILRTVFEEE